MTRVNCPKYFLLLGLRVYGILPAKTMQQACARHRRTTGLSFQELGLPRDPCISCAPMDTVLARQVQALHSHIGVSQDQGPPGTTGAYGTVLRDAPTGNI